MEPDETVSKKPCLEENAPKEGDQSIKDEINFGGHQLDKIWFSFPDEANDELAPGVLDSVFTD